MEPEKKTWYGGILSFVTGNNLFPLVVIGLLAFFAYQKFARVTESKSDFRPGVVTDAKTPGYVQKIIEKHYYHEIAPGVREEYLPKEELERKKPGSVSPDVLQDNNAAVVARAEVPAHRGPIQVDAVRRREVGPDNASTLKYSIDYRKLPPPAFDFKKEWRLGAYYGVAGLNVAEAQATVLPLRIYGVETAIQGRIGMEREGGRFNGQILVGVEY